MLHLNKQRILYKQKLEADFTFLFHLTLIDMQNKSKRGALVVFCLQFFVYYSPAWFF